MSLLREGGGDGVAVLRLNRPRVRNALGGELVATLGAALAELDDDSGVRVAVLTGTPPGFCAGSDLKELSRMNGEGKVRHEAETGRLARHIQHLGIPVIAAVEGFAMGGGFLLATSCDLVVTAGDARWHLPEVRLGWVPPWGVQSLVSRVGPVTARRLVWGERPLTGGELYALGAADELTVPGDALARALEVAAGLARLPAHAVTSAKRALADAVAGHAETLDARTAWMFGADCGSGAARRSLARFHSPV
ncbi:enoyl-CoA hydratase/isomerase family protein [Nonomuraea gerenzanensis]|uniref:Enoyl-CoA hydratase n=1 Tax=Nonomuraea gerenzanensis TaxID=93944 RepID=A0A1M4EAV7_9ACTN|nr:enoyl-CoA hydratase/isomerase family protein [Nonomuraea gerenzanensis]UBU18023.1 enoyl-CoA hydratase/isomerase family protein [Nonomuraea gerenzanensis]SBO95828.1 Enoyl-CoA hydratase [Nonomuraea gerenzanensis]